MARIRSIKPEFASDGKVLRLPDSTALFFVLLWAHCDDFGYFPWDTLELASKTRRWRSQEVFKMCSALVRAGLVRCSASVGVGQVVGWEHQRIKDKRASKWNDLEIKWDEIPNDAVGSRKNGLGEERRGKERSGGDSATRDKRRKGVGEPALQDALPGITQGQKIGTPDSRVIGEYHKLWSQRHGDRAPVMPKDRGLLQAATKELGEARVLEMLHAYFKMPDAYFIQKRHDVVTFHMNLSKIAAFADTGEFMTSTQTRQLDRTATTVSLIERIRRGEV